MLDTIYLYTIKKIIDFIVVQIDVRKNRRGNQEWTIQRHWQHWAHKTQNEDKHNTEN